MKKIAIISSGQPSSNPRLVKEADALSEFGYEVRIIYSFWSNWAWEADKKLFLNTKWNAIFVGGTSFQSRFIYFYTRLRLKFVNILLTNFGFYSFAELAKGRAYCEILRKTKSIKSDLYIAHNLAALPIAVKAAKFHKAKCGFDAEDFHRQELSDNIDSKEYKLTKYLEDKYLPQVDYLTAASPLIAAEYKKLYPQLRPVVINNVFSAQYLPSFENLEGINSKVLRLLWFSQTVGKGRGLEDVIAAMQLLKNDNLELHLLGNVSSATKSYFQSLAIGIPIFYYEPIAPDHIFEFASQFDIGLALEQNIPYNRDICLTNKIFTYLTSGLTIIASETSAQRKFMQTYPAVGKSYEIGNIEALAAIIKYYFEEKEALWKAQKASLELAKTELNWETESKKFLVIINKILKYE